MRPILRPFCKILCGELGFMMLAIVPSASLAMPSAQEFAAPNPALAEDFDDVRTKAIEAYIVRRGLRERAEDAERARRIDAQTLPGLLAVAPLVGTAVSGSVEIPIVAVTFSNSPAPPYPVTELQKELFNGPWPTGTMSEFYSELSSNRFDVMGSVFDWIELPQSDIFYSGPRGCNGICAGGRLADMLTFALAQIDQTTDFTKYDNNGSDNIPNSVDDDGFVDFVAFVHPEKGGECAPRGMSDDIWSHRFSIQSLTGSNFTTNDRGQNGHNIVIDDYVIMPALACDGSTMIPIGVFAHEFAHAFGLPDLYDTSKPQMSAGVGGWDLMASGSWGGNGSTQPMKPSHMSGWSKEYLGWVTPTVISDDHPDIRIRPIIESGDIVRIDYSDEADPDDSRYLLLEYRALEGFDESLTGGGLLVTEINNSRVSAGLVNNKVNASQFDMGVNVIEADGKRELDRNQGRGDAGDPFPGSTHVTSVDATHAEGISAAVCNIRQTPDAITLDIFTSRTTCPGPLMSGNAISPAEASSGEVVRGSEIIVEGVLSNIGTNYFTDRRLVVKGEGIEGGEIAVTAPAILEAMPPESSTSAEGSPSELNDLLGRNVIVRGQIQKVMQKNVGFSDILVIEQIDVVE